MPKNPSYPPINALLRGLEIFAQIGALGSASVTELHRRTGIPQPTIIRNLETLQHAGYVTRENASGLYTLTARVLALSAGYNHHRRLVELAAPILDDFRKSMPWPCDLAFFDADAMVIIETNRDPGALALNRPVGSRLPVTESALGRAYLAFCDEAQRRSALDTYYRSFPDRQNERAEFEKLLDKYKNQGFSENDRSLSDKTRGVGVPVIVDGMVEACINTIVLSEALSMQEVINRCVAPLQDVAAEVSKALHAEMTIPHVAGKNR